MNIKEAKKLLYSQIKNYSWVQGAGIKQNPKDGNFYIVVFVTSVPEQRDMIIPSTFLSFKVQVEFQGEVNPFISYVA
jgi:hypothetical protein